MVVLKFLLIAFFLHFSHMCLCVSDSSCESELEPDEPIRVIQQCTTGDIVRVTDENATLVTPTPPNRPKTCTFRFPRQEGVCQLKLEFEQFGLSLPDDVTKSCLNDYLSITGSTTVNSLQICGHVNKGEHMYLEYGEVSDIQIRIRTLRPDTDTYGYTINVTQIKCNSELRVPGDCLQYLTKMDGTVRSFNFPQAQLNDQYYKVCVHKADSRQNIQWKPCKESGAPDWSTFCIIGSNCEYDLGVPENTPCVTDFLNFPSFGKVCRPRFPETLTDWGFSFYVHFDAIEPLKPKEVLARSSSETCPSPSGPCLKSCDLTELGPPPLDYQPWKLSQDRYMCISEPIYSLVDRNNTGYCLSYSVLDIFKHVLKN